MTIDKAPATLAKLRLVRSASYSALLLVVGNWRQTVHSIKSLSSYYRRTLTPSVRWLDEPSVCIIHGASLSSSSSFAMNLVTKLAKAWALIVVLGWYSMSNSTSFIAHKTNHLAASGLFIAFHKGLFVWTTIMCAWKYGLSLRAAMIREKASFSIRGTSLPLVGALG